MAKIRVLIVDDHAIVRAGLRMLINPQPDMEVVGEAADGHEALCQAREANPDVLTLDLTMPGGGGLKTLERLRQACPLTRVLVLTMHEDPWPPAHRGTSQSRRSMPTCSPRSGPSPRVAPL